MGWVLPTSLRHRPFPGAMMAVFEKQGQIESHAGLGNESAPPGAAPLIGNRVMHDAFVRPSSLEAMLVNEIDTALEALVSWINQRIGKYFDFNKCGNRQCASSRYKFAGFIKSLHRAFS